MARIPLPATIGSRDGTLDRDSVVTNGVITADGEVAKRPGITQVGTKTVGSINCLPVDVDIAGTDNGKGMTFDTWDGFSLLDISVIAWTACEGVPKVIQIGFGMFGSAIRANGDIFPAAWDADGNIVELSHTYQVAGIYAVSNNGIKVGSDTEFSTGHHHALYWDSRNTRHYLPSGQTPYAYAEAVSDDGKIKGGHCYQTAGRKACYWNSDDNLVLLSEKNTAYESICNGVSANGVYKAGMSISPAQATTACRWDGSDVRTDLSDTGTGVVLYVLGVKNNGTVYGGGAVGASTQLAGYQAIDGTFTSMGVDGRIYHMTESGFSSGAKFVGGYSYPCYWNASGTRVDLSVSRGVAYEISDDGKTKVGYVDVEEVTSTLATFVVDFFDNESLLLYFPEGYLRLQFQGPDFSPLGDNSIRVRFYGGTTTTIYYSLWGLDYANSVTVSYASGTLTVVVDGTTIVNTAISITPPITSVGGTYPNIIDLVTGGTFVQHPCYWDANDVIHYLPGGHSVQVPGLANGTVYAL